MARVKDLSDKERVDLRVALDNISAGADFLHTDEL